MEEAFLEEAFMEETFFVGRTICSYPEYFCLHPTTKAGKIFAEVRGAGANGLIHYAFY